MSPETELASFDATSRFFSALWRVEIGIGPIVARFRSVCWMMQSAANHSPRSSSPVKQGINRMCCNFGGGGW